MNKKATVCFSGYRPEKFSFALQDDIPAYSAFRERLSQAILQAVQNGYKDFMTGMAKGFDLIAAEVVLELIGSAPECGQVSLIAVLPFEGHGFVDSWQEIHKLALRRAREIVTLSPAYSRAAYHKRNRYLVDHSSRLICYHDGQKGGTDFTVKYAQQMGVEIVNLVTKD